MNDTLLLAELRVINAINNGEIPKEQLPEVTKYYVGVAFELQKQILQLQEQYRQLLLEKILEGGFIYEY